MTVRLTSGPAGASRGLFDDDTVRVVTDAPIANLPAERGPAGSELARARRLLVCALPDAATRRAIEAQADAWSGLPRARRTRPSRLHMTLLPTRWMLPAQADALLRELAAVRFAPFTLELVPARWRDLPVLHAPSAAASVANVGATVRATSRAIVGESMRARAPEPTPAALGAVEALHRQLRIAMRRAGLGWPAAGLVPHVTLARGAPRALPPTDAPPLRWSIDRFWWVESTPYALEYQLLRDFPAAAPLSATRAPPALAGAGGVSSAALQHEAHDPGELFTD